eukprot:CAMPEP_0173171652 /NCGR_PEP_ID=MMETSP1141-20130122/1878_1 /TAXON_ID=483371 /ORGANISM="non described non described, Strain CCMP2298" /LENGTH=72 /DNA_ID=CAMNT_0014093613 /DNA_START=326 /DNA_END=540 /DNA_ORIENTATION=+
MAVSAVIYALLDPDDGVCEDIKNQRDCIFTPSASTSTSSAHTAYPYPPPPPLPPPTPASGTPQAPSVGSGSP